MVTQVVPLREAAAVLGVSVRAAEEALRRAGIKSGYPLGDVQTLAETRPGRGTRTDLAGPRPMTQIEFVKAFRAAATQLRTYPIAGDWARLSKRLAGEGIVLSPTAAAVWANDGFLPAEAEKVIAARSGS